MLQTKLVYKRNSPNMVVKLQLKTLSFLGDFEVRFDLQTTTPSTVLGRMFKSRCTYNYKLPTSGENSKASKTRKLYSLLVKVEFRVDLLVKQIMTGGMFMNVERQIK